MTHIQTSRKVRGTKLESVCVARKAWPEKIEGPEDDLVQDTKFTIRGKLVFEHVQDYQEAKIIEGYLLRRLKYQSDRIKMTYVQGRAEFEVSLEEILKEKISDFALEQLQNIAWDTRAEKYQLDSVQVSHSSARHN